MLCKCLNDFIILCYASVYITVQALHDSECLFCLFQVSLENVETRGGHAVLCSNQN